MLSIHFLSSNSGTFNISDVPEQWQPHVRFTPVPHQRYRRITIDVQPDDSSYRYRALMQPRQLVLKFTLPFFIEIPVGAWVEHDGESYYLRTPEDIKKQGTRNIEYSMTLGADDSNLADYKMRNTIDGRLKFSMCAKPHEFVDLLVANLNERDGEGTWTRGVCVESSEKTIEFNHTYCDAALNDMASTFETEWEIDVIEHIIHLRKVEYHKDDNDKLALSYGRGNGFVPGVGRTSESDGKPLKRLYVQGGETNIDRSKYGDTFEYSGNPGELRLPKSQTLEHDGRTYVTDAEGFYIERSDVVSNAVREDSLDLAETYPKRVGKVTQWRDETVDSSLSKEKNFYDFVDDTIPPNLDFNSYLIEGETMSIKFQTGMLAGAENEFEVKYIHDAKGGKPGRRFEIVPQEIDGVTMPNETFRAKDGENGDTYAVFGIMLPDEYVCDNENESGAAWDMFREAAKYMREHEDQKFTFTGEVQSMWAKRNWERVGAYLVVGGYIRFTDNQFAVDGTDIRIVSIKDFLTNPYAPTVELSNSISSPNSASSAIKNIDNAEVIIDDTRKALTQFTKRRFRDAKETMTMLADAQLDNFNGTISPAAIQTMGILLGDESLQFLMGKTLDGIGSDDWSITYANNVLSAPSGYLRHMTIGVNTIKANRDTIEYLTWQMPSMNLAARNGEKYYVYAVVNRNGFALNEEQNAYINATVGAWEMHTTPKRIDCATDKFYLLVGVLNSEYNGERSFAQLFGFTEILPGRMTTDVIMSNDGKTYMNLRTGEICGRIKFLSDTDEYITIIEGGKIKSNLIDVHDIIAQKVVVGESGKNRVEIQPTEEGDGKVKIFDAENNEVSVFEGASYDAISKLYDASTGGDCTILSRTSEMNDYYGFNSGMTLGRGNGSVNVGMLNPSGDDNVVKSDTIPISKKWHTSAPTEIRIKRGHLRADAESATTTQTMSGTHMEFAKMSSAYAHIIVRVVTYADEALTDRIASNTIAFASASASCEVREDNDFNNGYIDNGYNSGFDNVRPGFGENNRVVTYQGESKSSGLINIANQRVKAPGGWHRIEIEIHASACVNGSSASFQWGFKQSPQDDIAVEYKNDSYVSRFFANGFCLGTRADNYVMAMRTANGMRFVMENNDIGFDFSNTGIRTRCKGQNWLPMPLLIYKASYRFNSATSKYELNAAHGSLSFNGSNLPISRTSVGMVTLPFPDTWVADLRSISVQNLLVQVNSYHATIDARVRNVTTSTIQVSMSDDASLNDGDFGIVIYYLPA